MNQLQSPDAQLGAVEEFFRTLAGATPRLQYAEESDERETETGFREELAA